MPVNKNVLQSLQRQIRHVNLSRDRDVQKQWKKYMKFTKGMSRMTKPQWYDFNYADYKSKGETRLRAAHEEIY